MAPPTGFEFYRYNPSLAGAILFAVIFGVSAIYHSVQIAKFRTWYFIPLLVGGVFELVGYGARGVSSEQTPNWTLVPYIIQTLLLLVAPALFAASIYMILGRIIMSIDGEAHSLIRKKWLTKVFVTGDVLSFFIQSGGGGMMANGKASSQKLGTHIILGGLLLQVLMFGFFIVVSLVFHLRMRAMPTRQSLHPSLPWEKFLHVLYFTSALIMVRSIVRLIEFAQGFDGVIIEHEWFLYVFDAVPMAAVMLIFNVWYPSHFSKEARRAVLDRECADSSGNLELQNE